jgi:hypothetical protein
MSSFVCFVTLASMTNTTAAGRVLVIALHSPNYF